MYLPDILPKARVLITVKTYPLPSGEYYELVCTAGLFEGKRWIRIYPVPFRFLQNEKKYPKYSWIEADLERNTKDIRPESYRFKQGDETEISVINRLTTDQNWAERSKFVLDEVYYSMDDLIERAKGSELKSLATLKPKEIISFHVEPAEREWKQKWQNMANQITIDDYDENLIAKERKLIPKLPYSYYYSFISEGDTNPRKLQIEDWEIGALYWNCLRLCNGDETEANKRVRMQYYDNVVKNKNIHLFLGTTKRYHSWANNPFTIIGVYYPPCKHQQLSF